MLNKDRDNYLDYYQSKLKEEQNTKVSMSKGALKDDGVMLVSPYNASDWTPSGTTVTNSFSSPSGNTRCIEFNTTTQYASAKATVDFDISDANVFGYWIWVEDCCTLSSYNIRMTGVADDWTNVYVTPTLWCSTSIHEGWNYIEVLKKDLTVGGSPSNRIKMVKIEVNANQYAYDSNWKATTTPVTTIKFRFGGLYKNPVGSGAKVILSFDSASTYVKAVADMMSPKGMVGSLYTQLDTVLNGTTMIPKSDLDTLYANGWDICNDTYSRLGDFSALTDAQITSDLQQGIDAMYSLGYDRGALHGAAVHNYTDKRSLAIIKNLGFKTFRGGKAGYLYNMYSTSADSGILSMNCVQMTNTIAQADIISWLNKAVIYNCPIQIFGHGAMTSPQTYYASPEMYQFLIDEIYARGIPTLTISEFYDNHI